MTKPAVSRDTTESALYAEALCNANKQIQALSKECNELRVAANICGSGPGCLYRDALIDALTEQLHSAQNEQKSALTKANLMDAALSASAKGMISGTTNWAAYVLQYLKGEPL